MTNNFLKTALLGILLFAHSSLHAQKEIPLYTGDIPNSKACPNKEISGVSGSGRKFVKNVTVPTLSVFFPAHQKPGAAAIIICPGGGYSMLSIGDGGTDTAEELAKYGMVAFVLKYRLSDENCNENNSLVALQDVQQAMLMVRKNAKKWNIDPHKLGLLGYSAGGHLAAIAATHCDSPQIDPTGISLRPDFTILAYPIISFTDQLTANSKSRINLLGKTATENQKKWFSAELNVNSSTPPAFLIHASDDSTALVNHSIAYYQALQKSKISAKLILYQNGGHGFASFNKKENDHWLQYAVKWMQHNNFIN